MKREFKFRSWIISQKKMIKVFGFNEHLVFEQTWDSPSIKENIFEIEDCVLMQFTGVKDKKGVDVYEGDKIIYKNFKGYSTIVFKNGVFGYYGISCFITLLETNADYIEVIGNVFQDSE